MNSASRLAARILAFEATMRGRPTTIQQFARADIDRQLGDLADVMPLAA